MSESNAPHDLALSKEDLTEILFALEMQRTRLGELSKKLQIALAPKPVDVV